MVSEVGYFKNYFAAIIFGKYLLSNVDKCEQNVKNFSTFFYDKSIFFHRGGSRVLHGPLLKELVKQCQHSPVRFCNSQARNVVHRPAPHGVRPAPGHKTRIFQADFRPVRQDGCRDNSEGAAFIHKRRVKPARPGMQFLGVATEGRGKTGLSPQKGTPAIMPASTQKRRCCGYRVQMNCKKAGRDPPSLIPLPITRSGIGRGTGNFAIVLKPGE